MDLIRDAMEGSASRQNGARYRVRREEVRGRVWWHMLHVIEWPAARHVKE